MAAAFPGKSWVSAPISSSWVGQEFLLIPGFHVIEKYGCSFLRKSYSSVKQMKTQEVVTKTGLKSRLEPVAP